MIPSPPASLPRLPIDAGTCIGIFDSGSGGLVTTSWVARILEEVGIPAGVLFIGDTANLPYGTKPLETVAAMADIIIDRLSPICPAIGIACNTASTAWERAGRRGKSGTGPRIFSIVDVGAEQAYAKARIGDDRQSPRRCKSIGVLGTELTVDCQAHADRLIELHRNTLSLIAGHELPLVLYELSQGGPTPTLPRNVIHYDRTPHIAVTRESFMSPDSHGGISRAHVRNLEPPLSLPHDIEIVSLAAQRLVNFVDVEHVFTGDGLLKPIHADPVRSFLRQVSRDLQQRKVTSVILGCSHFEFFSDEFSLLLPGMAARSSIVSPSGTLAWALVDFFQEFRERFPAKCNLTSPKVYAHFTGPQPSAETLQALGLQELTLLDTI